MLLAPWVPLEYLRLCSVRWRDWPPRLDLLALRAPRAWSASASKAAGREGPEAKGGLLLQKQPHLVGLLLANVVQVNGVLELLQLDTRFLC